MIGEIFLVIGVGLIGHITAQLLRATGCRVLAMDLREDLMERPRLGRDCRRPEEGATAHTRAATGGHGVDAVIFTASTPSSEPAVVAANACREKGRIVVVGAGRGQDKGQNAMLDQFLKGLSSDRPSVPLTDLFVVSEATLAIVGSLSAGEEVELTHWAHEDAVG